MPAFKLCYIDDNKAWFTDNFEKQWGDDWNDIPYEHNAEPPYNSWSELIEDNEIWSERKWQRHPITLKVLYFELPKYINYLPCDNFLNSPYSVENINKGQVAWIYTKDFSIYAGTLMEDFIKIIKEHDGKIYREMGD